MSHSLSKVAVSLVLVSIVMVAFFSFATMAHSEEGNMQAGCPFSVIGATLCPQNLEAAVIHHISAYQSFFAIFSTSGATALIIALLALVALVCAALLRSLWSLLYKPPERIRYVFNTPTATREDHAVIRWLSLLENSPSTV